MHHTEKATARENIVEALKEVLILVLGVDLLQYGEHPTAEIAVRINASRDGALHDPDDLKALIPVIDRIDAIVVPKFTYNRYRGLGAAMEKYFVTLE